MNVHAPEVEASLKSALSAAHGFLSSVPPNEMISEFDLIDIKSKIGKIGIELSACSPDNLIQKVDQVLEELGFPEIEHDVASRGLLIVKLKGLELVSKLQTLRNKARYSGYFDPTADNINLQGEVPEDYLKSLNAKLAELHGITKDLQKQIERNKQSGVSIGFGPISIDIGVVLDLIQNSTLDAQEYLSAKATISAQVLQSKLQTVSSSSMSLMEALKSKAKMFGKRVLDLSVRVADAATQSYIKGLELIKGYFEAAGKHRPSLDRTSAQDAPLSVERLARVEEIIRQKVIKVRSEKRMQVHFLKDATITDCRFMDSHGSNYIVFSYRLDTDSDSLGDQEITVREILTGQEFNRLSKVEQRLLVVISRRVNELYRS